MLDDKIDMAHTTSKDDLCYHLGLFGVTIGKRKIGLAGFNAPPLASLCATLFP